MKFGERRLDNPPNITIDFGRIEYAVCVFRVFEQESTRVLSQLWLSPTFSHNQFKVSTSL